MSRRDRATRARVFAESAVTIALMHAAAAVYEFQNVEETAEACSAKSAIRAARAMIESQMATVAAPRVRASSTISAVAFVYRTKANATRASLFFKRRIAWNPVASPCGI